MSNADIQVNLYGYIPALGANAAAIGLFGVLWGISCLISIIYSQWWFGIAWFIGIGLEVGGYIARTVSNSKPLDVNDFIVQIICLTLAPAFLSGGIYYFLGKIVVLYGKQYSMISPMMYAYIFMMCDLISIVLQAVGGGMAAVALQDGTDSDPGTHIMVAGIAFQVASISLFLLLGLDFWRRYARNIPFRGKKNIDINNYSTSNSEYIPDAPTETINHYNENENENETDNSNHTYDLSNNSNNTADITEKQSNNDDSIAESELIRKERLDDMSAIKSSPLMTPFIYSLILSMIFIYVRCIYRVVELAEGWSGFVMTHEAYFLVLDGFMILIAIIILTVMHPGFLFKKYHVPMTNRSSKKSKSKKNKPSNSNSNQKTKKFFKWKK